MGIDHLRIEMLDRIIRDWLVEPDLLIFAGLWAEGAVMEIVPKTPPTLTGPLYEGCFAGLRDLLLRGESHHLHLDLGRLTRATYLVSPSVCYGFRPSFEMRLHASSIDPSVSFGFGFGLRTPYRGSQIDRVSVRRFFERFSDHRAKYPEVVSLVGIDAADHRLTPQNLDWTELGGLALGDFASDCRSAGDLAKLLMHPAIGA
jgi:hypothetical protein